MNRPLTSSPSRSFSFSPSDPRCPSVRVRPSVPAPSWSTHPRLPVCPCSACRVTRLLFIRPQVRFECKMRKKVRRSLARSSPLSPSLSLSLSLSLRHPLQNHSSPRSGLQQSVHTSSTERARAEEQIWTASPSFSFFVLGQLSLSFVLPASVLVFVCIIVDFGRPLAWMKGRRRTEARRGNGTGRRLTANFVRWG